MKLEGLELPRYDGENIVNISNSILRVFGLPVKYRSLKRELHTLIQCEKILLIILDGLRYDVIEEICSEHEGLKIFYRNLYKITSVFPTSTPTALASISLGVPPIMHGILGTVLYIRELGMLINTLSLSPQQKTEERELLFKMGIDVTKFIANTTTIYYELSEAGIRSLVMIPKGLKNGISKIIYRGAEIQEYSSIVEALIECVGFLNTNDRSLAYIYSPVPDEIAHKRGIVSEHYRESILRILEVVAKYVEKGTRNPITLILTTDHGLIETSEKDFIDMNKLRSLVSRLVAPPYGESRASFLTTLQSLEDCDDIKYLESQGFILVDKSTLISCRLLGNMEYVDNSLIGNYVLISKSSKCLRYSYNLKEHEREPLLSMHGSLTMHEIEIPLIIINY